MSIHKEFVIRIKSNISRIKQQGKSLKKKIKEKIFFLKKKKKSVKKNHIFFLFLNQLFLGLLYTNFLLCLYFGKTGRCDKNISKILLFR